MEIINNQLFGVGALLRTEAREFVHGGGGLEPEFGYAVDIQKIEAAQNPGKAAQFIFRTIVREPGFEGVERSVYVDVPVNLAQVGNVEPKTKKKLEIDHDEMFTLLLSIGYTPDQIKGYTANGQVQYGQLFANAPGRGRAYVYADIWERKVIDKATKTVVMNVAGVAETEEKITLSFQSPESYTKTSYHGREARAQAARGASGAPSLGAPTQQFAQPPQGQQFAQPAPGAVPAGGGFGGALPPQPGMMAPPQQGGGMQGYTAPNAFGPQGGGAPALPNGQAQYGQPAPGPGGIMQSLQTPRQ